MAGASKYLAQQVLLHTLVNTPMVAVASHKIGLFTADPQDSVTAEVDSSIYTWYSRQVCDAWSQPVDIGVGGTSTEVRTTGIVAFGPVVGDPIHVYWVGIFDAANATSLLYSGQINGASGAPLTEGDILQFSPSGVVVTVD